MQSNSYIAGGSTILLLGITIAQLLFFFNLIQKKKTLSNSPYSFQKHGEQPKLVEPNTAQKNAQPEPIILSNTTQPKLYLPSSQKITDSTVLNLLNSGIQKREEGDTLNSIARLRDALQLQKDHPRILYELGVTYSQMQLQEKSAGIFSQIIDIGEKKAGDYYSLASIQLGQKATSATSPDRPPTNFTLGEIVESKSELDYETTIKIPIYRNTSSQISSENLDVYLFYFDQQADGRVIRNDPQTSDISWLTLPIDWENKNEPEILIAHHQDDIKNTSRYYGCIVKIYYNDVLQDIAAKPRTLFDLSHLAKKPVDKNDKQLDSTLFDFE